MVSWLIIAILLILLFVFYRMRYVKHKVFAVVFILILFFLYITASRVLAGYNINWKSVAGIEKAVKVYFAWFGGVFDNAKAITGNAIKMDWTKKNETESKMKVLEKG